MMERKPSQAHTDIELDVTKLLGFGHLAKVGDNRSAPELSRLFSENIEMPPPAKAAIGRLLNKIGVETT